MKIMGSLLAKKSMFIAAIIATMLVSCTSDEDLTTDDEDEELTTEEIEAQDATAWIDECLESYYLYNEEYKTMERDLTLDYDEFLNSTLLSMTTNVLDRKYYESYYQLPIYDYLLYSYVLREDISSKSRATMDSRYGVGYGIVATELVLYGSGYAIAVHGVYNDSPADESGLTRGVVITQIDGAEIEWQDYYNHIISLCYPSEGDQITFTTHDRKEHTLTASTIEVNPILHYEIIDQNIGYLVYCTFDTNFDSDLKSVISEFATAGVSDLILDLRINPGGYTSSSNLLSSMIGGSYATSQIFSYYRFNEDLTSNYTTTANMMGYTYDSSAEMFYEKFTSVSTKLSLPSTRLYCLVSDNTASASELLINSLRGIDFEVTLIGSQTEGKNVGMIAFNEVFGDYEYDLLPITFESFNAKMVGGYEEGFSVDYEVNDIAEFADYSSSEPMVTKALELITGVVQDSGTTRSSIGESLMSTGSGIANRNRGGAVAIPLK
ncbi:MAG: S41 family peptidase [Rikenellaceae bacterium]